MKPDLVPSRELYLKFRVYLLDQGSTLLAWSLAKGFKRQNVARALKGDWSGPAARALVNIVRAELGEGENAV